MFPRRFFAGRFFAPRYFPQSAGVVPTPAAVNMVADQQGYLFYAIRGMRSIILLMWG